MIPPADSTDEMGPHLFHLNRTLIRSWGGNGEDICFWPTRREPSPTVGAC